MVGWFELRVTFIAHNQRTCRGNVQHPLMGAFKLGHLLPLVRPAWAFRNTPSLSSCGTTRQLPVSEELSYRSSYSALTGLVLSVAEATAKVAYT